MDGNTICVIQARVGSSRLPGKVMLSLSGEPVVAHVIRRCKAIESVSAVVCAIPEDSANDALAALAESYGAAIYRGSEDDVLDRYYQAARPFAPEHVMRVTSDCPLLDPEVCGALVARVKEAGAGYGITEGFPHGLDCEVMTFAALEKAHKVATHKNDREHVTLWIKRQDDIPRANLVNTEAEGREHRWTLDYPEDRDFMDALFALLPAPPAMPGWRSIVEVVRANPDLKALNAAQAAMWDKATKAIVKEAAASD